METNQSNVSYMKEYLKHAVEFEKFVYIWTNAMNDANSKMREIYARRNEIDSARASAHNSLQNIDSRYSEQQQNYLKQASRYNKRANICFAFVLIELSVLLFLAFLAEDIVTALEIAIFVVYLFFGTFIGPVSIAVGIYNKSKRKSLKRQANPNKMNDSRHKQEILLKEYESRADNERLANIAEETALSGEQEEISKALQEAKESLADVYSKNVLPAKYRSFNAVATLYEYLDTGRCNTIEGHGGIYDTYEGDLKLGLIISTLSDIRDTMYRIEANQQYLYKELQEANQTLSGINTSLGNIEKTNEQIARNTAISAVANQQTAAATSWMAWNTWVRG